MITAARLRELRVSYASVTRESRTVTRVTHKCGVLLSMRACARANAFPKKLLTYSVFRANRKTSRNRVTCVTVRLSRVTARVTPVTNHLFPQKKGGCCEY